MLRPRPVPDRVRVLFFISSLEQGGAERQVAELVRGLDLTRYEPHLAVCNETDQLGYSLPFASRTALDAPSGPEPRTLPRLVRLLQKLRPHLLHSYLGHQNIYGRLAVRLAGVGLAIGSVRCTQLSAQYIRHERLTNRFTDGLIVNSVGIRDELVRCAGVDAGKVDVVENGVDGERFRPLSADERAVERERFGMRGPTIIVPGRISSQKNQVAIVRALARMRAERALPPDLEVLLAGRQEASTRYGTLLRAAIAAYRLHRVVRFIGVVRDVERLMGAADAMLLASHYEGLPNVVLESMASGCPAIVSAPANADALVREGREGVAFGAPNPAEIARGIERFLRTGPAEREAMGRAGRQHVAERFTVERMVSRTAAVYERVLGRTR